jgi:choline dehydrogenase-like flavoprotein
MSPLAFDADLVVIGSGFGATMTALTIAHKLHPPALRDAQNKLRTLLKDDPEGKQPATRDQQAVVQQLTQQLQASGELRRIVILERGTWWTTPVPTLQDPKIKTPGFLADRNQPVQYWSSLEHFKGLIDLFTRCLRRRRNEDGLYDLSRMGKRGFLGLFGNQNDGVSVLRASGVGGGSLVYSNITVRPPEFIFDDAWDTTWTKADRDTYYELAKHAIGYGIPLAWNELAAGNIPYKNVPNVAGATNAGLSNISTQTSRLDPHWQTSDDPFISPNSPRTVKRLGDDGTNWLPRARAFQAAMKAMRPDAFHTVDSSINDLTPERTPSKPPPVPPPSPPAPYDPVIPLNHPPSVAFPKIVNHCERQGRCTLGCLPGARHTLNKQLLGAAYGKPTDPVPVPLFPNIEIRALVEVNLIKRLDNGYVVEYYGTNDRSREKSTPITARRVIVAAGCLGTNELLLRCQAERTLPGLSPRLGEGFSTNGDFLAFLDETKEPVNLARGPVQTSVAHFNDKPGEDHAKFHIVEDQGIPKTLSSSVRFGVPLVQALTYQSRLRLWWALFRAIVNRGRRIISQVLANARNRQEFFESEEELTMKMMCITASGRAKANGKFTLGETRRGETALRIKPVDDQKFHKDPIFDAIVATLNGKGGLADQLRPPDKPELIFRNPFLSPTLEALEADSVTISHPLGGCRIGKDATRGVVDEYGHVFDASAPGKYHDGLYVADASIIPSALGVNPSLTISALALRIGQQIATEMSA